MGAVLSFPAERSLKERDERVVSFPAERSKGARGEEHVIPGEPPPGRAFGAPEDKLRGEGRESRLMPARSLDSLPSNRYRDPRRE